MKLQKITLWIFFPAMYACAFTILTALWFASEYVDEGFYKLIPSFLVIGIAAIVTWGISNILEFKNIAKGIK